MHLLFVLGLFACSSPPIPQAVVDEVAASLSALGHPNASFEGAEVVNSSRGTFSSSAHDRYVDVAITYRRAKKSDAAPHTMTVRIYLESVQPCRVSLDVLADDGPTPVLLDNGLASAAIGEKICASMAP
jgi:hypothetical protein